MSLTLRNLSCQSIETIFDQLEEGDEIQKIVSVSTGAEYLYDRLSFLGNPPKGKYKLVLEEQMEGYFELCLCGSYLMWLHEKNPQSLASQVLGSRQQCYLRSADDTYCKYSLSVVAGMLVVALDFSEHNESFLSMSGTQSITTTEGRVGSISAQVHDVASTVPLSTIAHVITSHSVTGVLFTGAGWSGTVAHASALMFLEMGKRINIELIVKSVSFFGPLCGSPKLHEYIKKQGQIENHVTVNCHGNILDRILGNFQRLCPLPEKNKSSWEDFHTALTAELASIAPLNSGNAKTAQEFRPLQVPQDTQNRYEELKTYEENLENNCVLCEHMENDLRPIGTYFLKCDGAAEVFQQAGAFALFKRLDQSQPPNWGNAYSLNNWTRDELKELLGSDFSTISLQLKPTIKNIKIIRATQRVTLTFEGVNLEAIFLRELSGEMVLTNANVHKLPFRFQDDIFDFSPGKSKVLDIHSSHDKVIIRLYLFQIPAKGHVVLLTDFGRSNDFHFDEEHTHKEKDYAPSTVLHRTMNAKLLSAAFLRVALCSKQAVGSARIGSQRSFTSLLAANYSINFMWNMLLDVERFVTDGSPSKLESALEEYLNGDKSIDITELRNECLHQFEFISSRTTEEWKYKENVIKYHLRKGIGMNSFAMYDITCFNILNITAGYVGMTIGSAMGVVATGLSVPSKVLTSPGDYALDMVDDGTAGHKAATAYSRIAGILGGVLSVPSAVVGGVSHFLLKSGAMAAEDFHTVKYKGILTQLIVLLQGNPSIVVDELEPLEDEVIATFNRKCPKLKLELHYPEDIQRGLEEIALKDSKKYNVLSLALKDVQNVSSRLCLVGRIHAIRKLLQNQYMIAFVGTHNAGKSTTIESLFDIRTGGDMLKRTIEPNQYLLGGWMNEVAKSHETFRNWREEGNDREGLQVKYNLDVVMEIVRISNYYLAII